MKNEVKIAVAMAEAPLKKIIREQEQTIKALRFGLLHYEKKVIALETELSYTRDEATRKSFDFKN